MFIKEVEYNGEWSVLCEQSIPCYKELGAGCRLVTAPGRGIALCLADGTRLKIARMGGRWAFLHIRGEGQPSPALRQEVDDFLTPLWESPWLSHCCK